MVTLQITKEVNNMKKLTLKDLKVGDKVAVHSFVEYTTGDIYKAATYKTPAKNGVRGNIFADDLGKSVIDYHGARYIK